MTFFYRTPTEELISKFTSDEQARIYSPAQRLIENIEVNVSSLFFNYHLSETQKKFFFLNGIDLSPFSFRPHSHPACKTLENYFLFSFLPSFISHSGIKELFLFSIKKAKVARLRNLSDNVQLNLLNRLVEVKDKMRYGMDVSPERIAKKNVGLDIFLHDELHHWSKAQLISFLEVHRPRNLLATFVFPVEILGGFKSSVSNFLYEFECKNNRLHFYPDGVMQEAYIQTLESSYLFKTNLIKTSRGNYSVSLHRSIGAHHFFQISRYESELLQTHRSFGPYDVLDVGSLFKGKVRVPIEGIGLARFKKILIYLLSLKKPDVNSAIAKLRQLSGDDVSLNEMWVIRDLADRIANGISKWSSCGIRSIIRDWMVDLCPFKKNFEKYNLIDDFDRHLMQVKPLSFTFNCSDEIDYSFEPEEDLPEFIDDFWTGASVKMQKDPLIDQILLGRSSSLNSFEPSSFTEAMICIFQLDGDFQDWKSRPKKVILRGQSSIYTVLTDDIFDFPQSLPAPEGFFPGINEEDVAFFPFLSGELEIDDYAIRMSVLNSLKGRFALYRAGAFEPALFANGVSSFSSDFGHTAISEVKSNVEVPPKEAEIVCHVSPHIEAASSSVPLSLMSKEVCEYRDTSSSEESGASPVDVGSMENLPAHSNCHIAVDPIKIEPEEESSAFKVFSDEPYWSYGSTSLKVDFESAVKNSIFKRLKGRIAFFYHTNGLPYYHDRVLYRTNPVESWLSNILESANKHFKIEFNSCLLQIYEENGSIPWHFDNEDCYEQSAILTLNFSGTCLFEIQNLTSRKLEDGDFLLMKSGLQSLHRRRVSMASKGRISLTLRVQNRSPNFSLGLRFLPEIGCFLRAVSDQVLIDVEDLAIKLEGLFSEMLANNGVKVSDVGKYAKKLGINLTLRNGFEVMRFENNGPDVCMSFAMNHYRSISQGEAKKGKGIESLPKELARKTSDEAPFDCNEQIISNLNRIYGNFLNSKVFQLNPNRAQKLLKSLLQGSTGIHCSSKLKDGWKIIPNAKTEEFVWKNYIESSDSWKGSMNWNAKINVTGIFGFAGSGKSHGLQTLLNEKFANSDEIILISPRLLLLEDWKAKVKGLKALTFESALKGCLSNFKWIILDEVTLFPNGYLDLLMLKMSHYNNIKSRHITLVGDPLQANYYSEKDCNLLGNVRMIDSVFPDVRYIYQSFRIPQNVANRFGVYDKNSHLPYDNHGTFYCDMSSARKHASSFGAKIEIVLVASELEKKYFSEQVRCITYGESQGLTFDFGLISLSEESRLCSDNHIYVALTRFKKGFGFFQNFRGDLKSYKSNLGSKLLGRYINLSDSLKPFMERMLDINLTFLDDRDNVGSGNNIEEKTAGDPWLKGLLDLQQTEEFEECSLQEVISLESTGKVHLPLASLNDEFESIRSRESREFKCLNFDWSMQFEDCGVKLKRSLNGNFSENFSAIYPVHQACDELTFLAAVKKRLRFSNPAKNLQKFKGATTAGKVLLDRFLKFIPIPKEKFPMLLDEAKREFQEVKLKKSEGTIAGNSNRSDPDWSWDKIFLFMKSQQCTKFEKRFVDAKAGQTLACFSHEILCHFSPWCRYMEKVFSMFCPKNFYIHQRKDFDKLAEFSRKYCRGGFCIESDYEAFDVSQDHNVLAFEVQLMEHMLIPEGIINDYIKMKTELGCKLGNFAIMRFTGEFCTFLFNTFCNMAFTFLRYEMQGNEPVCFAGDDMCALADLKESKEFDSFFRSFTLKAKVCRTLNPLFCGWRLTRFGLFKEPVLIFERLKIAMEKDKLDLVIESYFLEFCYAYKLGSWLEWVLDEKQADYQQRLSRFFVKKKHLLKGKAAELITHCDYLSDGSDEEDRSCFWEDCKRGYSNCESTLKFYLQ
ncbi:RNA polymerase [Grapevine berry inner necrosis virus]|uniref:RNA polymerase n=1 Tax=Grapevine berry inner necrosis virus TaxID=81877 RepID=Q91QY4_9VIRU|nr:RNA polymerase [Grapevine berry inner necrosis virus]BAB47271.2 RNA polymerase [Grapevine berry inner necrosis virus]